MVDRHLAGRSLWQASVGKRLVFLSVVTYEGLPLSVRWSLTRTSGKSGSLASCGTGYLWVLWDWDRKTWHDRIAGTRVVRVERGG